VFLNCFNDCYGAFLKGRIKTTANLNKECRASARVLNFTPNCTADPSVPCKPTRRNVHGRYQCSPVPPGPQLECIGCIAHAQYEVLCYVNARPSDPMSNLIVNG
jgi:hypothetical protein